MDKGAPLRIKTIGLIGGMSWESSIEYYRIINETVRCRLGGLHSAKCLMYSFDFAETAALQRRDAWDQATARIIDAGKILAKAGADFIVICTNTMHKMAPELQAVVTLPLLHIVDPTAERVKARGVRRVGLLATRFTMEEDFYVGRLTRDHDLKVVLPDEADRAAIHEIIFDELCCGVIKHESCQRLQMIIRQLHNQGAEGVILGCTELGLLIKPDDCSVPLFDTTVLHAEAAAEHAIRPLHLASMTTQDDFHDL
jgi:aspartate racemase